MDTTENHSTPLLEGRGFDETTVFGITDDGSNLKRPRRKSLGRRVSFAEAPSLHIFPRDDEYETPTRAKAGNSPHAVGERRSPRLAARRRDKDGDDKENHPLGSSPSKRRRRKAKAPLRDLGDAEVSPAQTRDDWLDTRDSSPRAGNCEDNTGPVDLRHLSFDPAKYNDMDDDNLTLDSTTFALKFSQQLGNPIVVGDQDVQDEPYAVLQEDANFVDGTTCNSKISLPAIDEGVRDDSSTCQSRLNDNAVDDDVNGNPSPENDMSFTTIRPLRRAKRTIELSTGIGESYSDMSITMQVPRGKRKPFVSPEDSEQDEDMILEDQRTNSPTGKSSMTSNEDLMNSEVEDMAGPPNTEGNSASFSSNGLQTSPDVGFPIAIDAKCPEELHKPSAMAIMVQRTLDATETLDMSVSPESLSLLKGGDLDLSTLRILAKEEDDVDMRMTDNFFTGVQMGRIVRDPPAGSPEEIRGRNCEVQTLKRQKLLTDRSHSAGRNDRELLTLENVDFNNYSKTTQGLRLDAEMDIGHAEGSGIPRKPTAHSPQTCDVVTMDINSPDSTLQQTRDMKGNPTAQIPRCSDLLKMDADLSHSPLTESSGIRDNPTAQIPRFSDLLKMDADLSHSPLTESSGIRDNPTAQIPRFSDLLKMDTDLSHSPFTEIRDIQGNPTSQIPRFSDLNSNLSQSPLTETGDIRVNLTAQSPRFGDLLEMDTASSHSPLTETSDIPGNPTSQLSRFSDLLKIDTTLSHSPLTETTDIPGNPTAQIPRISDLLDADRNSANSELGDVCGMEGNPTVQVPRLGDLVAVDQNSPELSPGWTTKRSWAPTPSSLAPKAYGESNIVLISNPENEDGGKVDCWTSFSDSSMEIVGGSEDPTLYARTRARSQNPNQVQLPPGPEPSQGESTISPKCRDDQPHILPGAQEKRVGQDTSSTIDQMDPTHILTDAHEQNAEQETPSTSRTDPTDILTSTQEKNAEQDIPSIDITDSTHIVDAAREKIAEQDTPSTMDITDPTHMSNLAQEENAEHDTLSTINITGSTPIAALASEENAERGTPRRDTMDSQQGKDLEQNPIHILHADQGKSDEQDSPFIMNREDRTNILISTVENDEHSFEESEVKKMSVEEFLHLAEIQFSCSFQSPTEIVKDPSLSERYQIKSVSQGLNFGCIIQPQIAVMEDACLKLREEVEVIYNSVKELEEKLSASNPPFFPCFQKSAKCREQLINQLGVLSSRLLMRKAWRQFRHKLEQDLSCRLMEMKNFLLDFLCSLQDARNTFEENHHQVAYLQAQLSSKAAVLGDSSKGDPNCFENELDAPNDLDVKWIEDLNDRLQRLESSKEPKLAKLDSKAKAAEDKLRGREQVRELSKIRIRELHNQVVRNVCMSQSDSITEDIASKPSFYLERMKNKVRLLQILQDGWQINSTGLENEDTVLELNYQALAKQRFVVRKVANAFNVIRSSWTFESEKIDKMFPGVNASKAFGLILKSTTDVARTKFTQMFPGVSVLHAARFTLTTMKSGEMPESRNLRTSMQETRILMGNLMELMDEVQKCQRVVNASCGGGVLVEPQFLSGSDGQPQLKIHFIDCFLSIEFYVILNMSNLPLNGYPFGALVAEVEVAFCAPAIQHLFKPQALASSLAGVKSGYYRLERMCVAVGSVLASLRKAI